MVQRKKKSTRPHKKTKKVERQLTRVIANKLLRLMKWLVVAFTQIICKNPLVSLGFFLFLGFFSFFAYHASFNQNIVSRSFFFENTNNKPKDETINLTINELLQNSNSSSANSEITQTGSDYTNLPAPIERPTVMRDTQTQTASINRPPFLNVIPQLKPKPLTTSIPSGILSKEKAQIMRVQAALRSFGNNGLVVNGIADNKTKKAILAFQKMFILKETGIIDRELLTKMREVGLIENDTKGLY